MDSGLYAACAGLIARTQALDVTANNLANINTSGYRGQHETFRELLASRDAGRFSAVNRAVNSYGVLGASHIDQSQGQFERTGADLDVGIEGSGFFRVQTAGGVMYTRNGNFHLAKGGTLVTTSGDAVMGEQGPIHLPDGTPSISPDGTISVNGALAGKVQVTDFAPGASLEATGNGYYSAKGAKEQVSKGQVRQGMLESSNVNPMSTAVSLIGLQRHAEMLQRALSTFHAEFNRIAAEELPKV